MDCEKFEPLLLDELYDELDELTSAAVKRHVSGCARCGTILNGLRATRRAVTLPLVPVPEGLEERILAAAREAQKVVPIRSRMSRALSVAGSWAMRPQTAMAALFLLMIGSSAFLIRSKNYSSKDSAVAVTVEGTPSPTAAPVAQSESLDDKAAAAAHGPSSTNVVRPPSAQPMASALAFGESSDPSKSKSDLAGLDKDLAPPPAATAIANAAAPAGAPSDPLSQQQAQRPYARSGAGPADQQDAFSQGAAAFRTRNYAEATRLFDQAAQTGDTNAALWAAMSTREGQGCAVALGRFEQLSQKATGWVGTEATLNAARCQIAMGQTDPAKDRLNKVAQNGSAEQKKAAQDTLADLSQVAGRKAGAGVVGGAAAAQKRAVSPARAAPAAPARAPAESEQKKSLDNNNTY